MASLFFLEMSMAAALHALARGCAVLWHEARAKLAVVAPRGGRAGVPTSTWHADLCSAARLPRSAM